jgi:hypothetical protein
MEVIIEDKGEFSQIKFKNPFLNNELSKEIDNINTSSKDESDFIEKFINIYGTELYDDLSQYNLIQNIKLHSLFQLFRNNGYNYLGFEYVKSKDKNPFNKCINSINISKLDKEVTLEGLDLSIIVDDFFEYKKEIINTAKYNFPIYLEKHIEENANLRDIYLDFLNFPNAERFNDIKIGNGQDGPIDRSIVGAVSILNANNYKTWSSCGGHIRYDEAGIEGVETPNILITLDADEYKFLIQIRNEDPKFEIITITPYQHSSGVLSYKLESGNKLILQASDTTERAVILSYYLSILNSYILKLHKDK